ncbi:MAG: hypothetical protein WC716_07775 [Chitinophagaceae bacterium]|jgi:hypothetical protein
MTLLKLTSEGTDFVYINVEELVAIREDGLGAVLYLKNISQPIPVEESASEILELLNHDIISLDDNAAEPDME